MPEPTTQFKSSLGAYDQVPNGEEEGPAILDYTLWNKDNLPVRKPQDDYSEDDVTAEYSRRETSLQRAPTTIGAIGQRWTRVWMTLSNYGVRCIHVVLAIALTARLSLGNILLAHVPFPTYVLSLVAGLPWSLAFGFQAESVSFLLLAFAAALSILLATLPLVQTIGFWDGLMAVVLPIVDASVSILVRRVIFTSWYQLHTRHGTAQTANLDITAFGKLNSIRGGVGVLVHVFSILARIASISGVAILPVAILSGELQDMNSNCYLLDSPRLWYSIAAGSALQGASLIFFFMNATTMTPFTLTFLQALVCGIAFVVFYYDKLTPQGWINICLCMVFTMVLTFRKNDGNLLPHTSGTRTFSGLARKAFLATVLYGAIYQGSYTLEEYLAAGTISLPHFVKQIPDGEGKINGSLVKLPVHDDYLGFRPSADTFADISNIMANCADVAGSTGVGDVVHCLSYLATSQGDYFISPQHSDTERAVREQTWGPEEIHKGEDNRKAMHQGAKVKPTSFKGVCSGPEITYHTYWTGPSTWRFELFIKAYLYTQNLSCSRLCIWLDTDRDLLAIDKMLFHDPLFQRFHALRDNDYIVLQKWTLPQRIPLPRASNAIDSSKLYKPSYPNANGEVAVADGVIQDPSGMLWLVPNAIYKTVSTPTQISDFVRFLVLHLHGGVYLDMDVLLLRDLRPLLLPDAASGHAIQPAWAEQWVEGCSPGDYNTAVLSLPANSSLTSYLLHGGLRMGMSFHPIIIGRMLWKDGRNSELTMLHNALFDPLVTNRRRKGAGVCTVPCHKNFESSFMGVVDEPENEWSNYKSSLVEDGVQIGVEQNDAARTNRSMEHFFRGAFAYHIHNQNSLQWWKFPEPDSWMDVITSAQDGFFAGDRTNVYGEIWAGPPLEAYDKSEWGWKQ
ncbi:MAG: hypothetical protein Q9217_002982 [Psora testacea]